jgi:hypothetical protein
MADSKTDRTDTVNIVRAILSPEQFRGYLLGTAIAKLRGAQSGRGADATKLAAWWVGMLEEHDTKVTADNLTKFQEAERKERDHGHDFPSLADCLCRKCGCARTTEMALRECPK